VYFRITAKAKTKDEALSLIAPVKTEMYKILGDNIYGEDGATLEEVIVNFLKQHNKKLAIAESVTGGLLAARIVNVPSASDVFLEGAVAYSNEAKIKNLNIDEATLKHYGTVSEETAKLMAKGIALASGADIAVATTGVAGPNTCEKNNPIGRIFIGIYTKEKSYAKEFNFLGTREKIRNFATAIALDMLKRELL